jgi:hypothetical protein
VPTEWTACLNVTSILNITPYTHQMKSRTEYPRKENLKAARVEVANLKRFRILVDQWADAALKLSQLKTRLGLHSGES